MLIMENFRRWFRIGWWLAASQSEAMFEKIFLTDMDFSMDLSIDPDL